jgi:hypothetical protein
MNNPDREILVAEINNLRVLIYTSGIKRLLHRRHLIQRLRDWISVSEIRIISSSLIELEGPGVNDRPLIEVIHGGFLKCS